MDRRLFDAYDKMTMPDGCSRRIEKLLLEGKRPRIQRKQEVVLPQKTGWRAWSSAAAMVCLAVVISLGGVFLFVKMQSQGDAPQFVQPTVGETKGNTEKAGSFDLSGKGREFLLAMCYAMPDWESYYVLDDRFWEDFLYASFTCPEEVTDTKAKTIIGEVPLENGAVLISREQAEGYAKLTMGCDLPVLDLREKQDGMGIWYDGGYYHVSLSDFGSRGYKLRKWVSYSEESCDALFSVYVDEEDNVIGSVRFKLRKADNENGFLIVGKQSELTLPEETVRKMEHQDVLADLSAEEGQFRQEVRETDAYTVHQYHLPWEGEMVSSRVCIVGGTTYGTGESAVTEPYQMYRLEGDSWEPQRLDTMNLRAAKEGKTVTAAVCYGEYEEGKRQSFGFWKINEGKWLEAHGESRWWIMGESMMLGDRTDNLWRLDLVTEELEDFWGAVPRGKRVHAINDFISEAYIFEDGCFVSAYLNEDREMCLLYADTVNGEVYDLEELVGRNLDDCVGLPGEKEILCWRDGEYWRISRDSLYPEYLGKLQENVLYASGVFGGDKALFAIDKAPGKTGFYRIYDFVGNRFLMLEDRDREPGEMHTTVSPDGRKLLIDGGVSLIQVLDCEKGMLLSIERQNWTGNGHARWLSNEEIDVYTYDENSCVYTLK